MACMHVLYCKQLIVVALLILLSIFASHYKFLFKSNWMFAVLIFRSTTLLLLLLSLFLPRKQLARIIDK